MREMVCLRARDAILLGQRVYFRNNRLDIDVFVGDPEDHDGSKHLGAVTYEDVDNLCRLKDKAKEAHSKLRAGWVP